jgi:hypothetical protein
MAVGDPADLHEGEVAFAANVQTLLDLTFGRVGWPVRLTRHSHATNATLTLANRTPGGPILKIVEEDLLTTVMLVTKSGLQISRVGQYVDLTSQGSAPAGPGIGSGLLRMYARLGGVYFKAEDGVEQQIPVGPPPGPSMRWSFWMSGG